MHNNNSNNNNDDDKEQKLISREVFLPMKDSSDEREMGEVVWEGGGVTLLTLLGYLLKLMKCQHASVARVFVMHTEQNINLNSLLKLFSHSSPSYFLPFFPFFSLWLLLRFSFFVGCQVVSANLAFGR